MTTPLVGRLRVRVGRYSIVELDTPLDSIPPFAVLDEFARECESFRRMDDAKTYAAQLEAGR